MNKRIAYGVCLTLLLVLFLTACNNVAAGSNTGNSSNPLVGTLAEKLQWLQDNAESDTTYVFELTLDREEIVPQTLFYPGKSNITIQLKGIGGEKVVALSKTGSLFNIGDGVTLVLDNNITLKGRPDNFYQLIFVESGGTLELNEGAKVTGNMGTGVAVNSGGTFLMNGGEITGNGYFLTATGEGSNGGGVCADYGSTFIMGGGKISGNTSLLGGGVLSDESFTMNEGLIADNIAGGYGGGVYLSAGTFTMKGGKIAGNKPFKKNYNSILGGGVFVRGKGCFTMEGGEISGNIADSAGGGVFVKYNNDGTTFNKTGGIIFGYDASDPNNSLWNKVVYSTGEVPTDRGSTVYAQPMKRWESTAGEDKVFSIINGNPSGEWEY